MSDRSTWLFNSAGFHGNPKWLFLHVLRNRPDIEAFWMADNAATAEPLRALDLPVVVKGTPEFRKVARRTQVWAVNQVKESIPKSLQGAVLLNLWHGVGTKGIERGMNEGYLRERIAKKYIQNNQAYHDRQLFLVTSPAMEKHFTKQIGLAERNIVRAGYPQNSALQFESFDHDLRARWGLTADSRLALYAPTPRRDQNGDFLAEMFPDMAVLADRLTETNTTLVFKMHPHLTSDPGFQRLRTRFQDHPHLKFWDNAEDVYEVMDQIDVAVVDYSSILYDLLAKGVTEVIRYIPDYDNGKNAVLQEGVDYLELSCGTIAEDFESLVAAIGEPQPVPQAELDRLNDYFWSYSTPEDLDVIVEAALAFTIEPQPMPSLHTYDVFDTILHRRGVAPSSITRRVKDLILAHPEMGFPTDLVHRFGFHRTNAEQALKLYYRRLPDRVSESRYEATLEEIIDWLAAHHDLTPTQAAQLLAWEVETEIESVIPNIERINELLSERDAGNRVILISDMYLSHDVVRQMVVKADPRLEDIELYVSSTTGFQKSTKKLFLEIYSELPYDFAQWIHTGDNAVSDVRSPRELGIKTRQVAAPSLDGLPRRIAERVPTYDGSIASGLISLKRASETSDLDYFTYSYLASVLVPYVDWVLEHAQARGDKKLVFIARDGDLLRTAADALIEARGLEMETQLIFGSRLAWRLASQTDGLEPETFTGSGLFGGYTGAEILSALDVDADTFNAWVPGFADIIAAPSMRTKERDAIASAASRSADLRAHLLQRANADASLVIDYLHQELAGSEQYSFVEFWGRGHTQDCLAKLNIRAFGEGTLTPMYYARSIYPSQSPSLRFDMTTADHNMIALESIFSNVGYSTTSGYVRENDRIKPIIEPRSHDAALLDSLRQQIVEFTRDYVNAEFADPSSVRIALFDAALGDFKRRPNDPLYAEFMAALPDAVAIGGEERELAPALTLDDLYAITLGSPVLSFTRSMPLSLNRSKPHIRRRWRQLREELSNGHTPEEAVATVRAAVAAANAPRVRPAPPAAPAPAPHRGFARRAAGRARRVLRRVVR